MLMYEDVQMRYECILQLSLIILMPERSEFILDLLSRNSQAYTQVLTDFSLGKKDEEFEGLVSRMQNKLKQISSGQQE